MIHFLTTCALLAPLVWFAWFGFNIWWQDSRLRTWLKYGRRGL